MHRELKGGVFLFSTKRLSVQCFLLNAARTLFVLPWDMAPRVLCVMCVLLPQQLLEGIKARPAFDSESLSQRFAHFRVIYTLPCSERGLEWLIKVHLALCDKVANN